MKTILAAVDFSEASFNALSYAAYLANTFNSTLVVVHAHPSLDSVDYIPIDYKPENTAELEKANLQYLQAQMQGIIRKYTVKIKGIIRKGNPVQVIRKVAIDEDASLIVIGAKGKGESNSIFGSTTINMIGKTKLPMIVVPENSRYRPIQNIAVAIDFKDNKPVSRFLLLNELIKKYDPLLNIINIQKKNSDLTPDFVSGKMRSGLIWSKYKHNFHIIENDKVEKGIDSFLKKNPADLLAMVAREHGLLGRVFKRSHTRTMTRQTQIPMLVMYPPKENKTNNKDLLKKNDMFGEMTTKESIDFLEENNYGRIGTNAFGRTYVVPISYAFHNRTLYFHTEEGMKIKMMRKNPEVCFQVDKYDGMAVWKSVILQGKFTELKGKERENGIKILLDRRVPAVVSETMKLAPDWPFTDREKTDIPGIVFKIEIGEITGRFENPNTRTR